MEFSNHRGKTKSLYVDIEERISGKMPCRPNLLQLFPKSILEVYAKREPGNPLK